MKKIDSAISFTEQLLERAETEDEQSKIAALQNHKGAQAIGEGYWPFHLKQLLSLLNEIKDQDLKSP